MAERTQWAAAFREGGGTLGAVIKDTMRLRDAHWSPAEAVHDGGGDRGGNPRGGSGKKQKTGGAAPSQAPQPAKKSTGETTKGQKVALAMKDGTKLCRAFQQGQCKATGDSCPGGSHQCAVVVNDSGRVCGLRNHGASQHRK